MNYLVEMVDGKGTTRVFAVDSEYRESFINQMQAQGWLLLGVMMEDF
jgi:hypothetical protein